MNNDSDSAVYQHSTPLIYFLGGVMNKLHKVGEVGDARQRLCCMNKHIQLVNYNDDQLSVLLPEGKHVIKRQLCGRLSLTFQH